MLYEQFLDSLMDHFLSIPFFKIRFNAYDSKQIYLKHVPKVPSSSYGNERIYKIWINVQT